MPKRMPIDAHVLGYWGFDEANATDAALDETSGARHLTVSNCPSVPVGRVGNARSFNGTSTKAVPANSVPFQQVGPLTISAWTMLTGYNSSGSKLRTLLSCQGSTNVEADNTLYALSVGDNGQIVYSHEYNAGQAVVLTTANGTLRTNRTYSIVLVRRPNGANQTIELYLNNKLIPFTSCTVNGASQNVSLPVPPPTGGSNAVLTVGASSKNADAFWNGWVDELSLHDVARPYQPYLIGDYYRIVLAVDTNRFTSGGTTKCLTACALGGDVRWWSYERDGSVYVVREGPLGYFSSEVQLTANLGNMPGGTEKPKIAYDPATDTLLIVFIAGGRVYKITGATDDAVETLYMPYTADQGTILKARDQEEVSRFGGGGSVSVTSPFTQSYPLCPTIQFFQHPTLGFCICIPTVSDSFVVGFGVHRYDGGAATRIGTVTAANIPAGFSYYLFPLTKRVAGASYFVRALYKSDVEGTTTSNVIVDRGQGVFWSMSELPDLLIAGRDSDLIDVSGSFGAGEANSGESQFRFITYVNRLPVKINVVDDQLCSAGAGGGVTGDTPFMYITYVNRSPLKFSLMETDVQTAGSGGGTSGTVGATGRSTVQLQEHL